MIGGLISKVMMCKVGQKSMTLNGDSTSPITHKQQLVERESGILKQQIILLTDKITLPR